MNGRSPNNFPRSPARTRTEVAPPPLIAPKPSSVRPRVDVSTP
jgi:hypothetical protein